MQRLGICNDMESHDLRETIDMGMDGRGELLIDYNCECWKCGWTYRYKRRIMVNLED